MPITKIVARQIFDSRGNPTVEVCYIRVTIYNNRLYFRMIIIYTTVYLKIDHSILHNSV